MITFVVNDKEAVLTPEHFIAMSVALVRMVNVVRKGINDAFVDGDQDRYDTMINEYIRVQALVNALDELGNALTEKEMEAATAWVHSL
jgi:hypothetical protein